MEGSSDQVHPAENSEEPLFLVEIGRNHSKLVEKSSGFGLKPGPIPARVFTLGSATSPHSGQQPA